MLASEIDQALTLVPIDGWKPPVLLTQAIDGNGVAELWDTIGAHRAALAEGDALDARRRDGMRRRLRVLALERMARDLDAAIDDAALDALAARVVARAVDPSAAADTLTAATRMETQG